MLKICHVNITSLKKHKDELLARFSDCDIISINETNLVKDSSFFLKGFNVYRNDRETRSGGGVLIATKLNIKCREVYNKTIIGNEAIAVEVETKTFGTILLASIYVPPKTRIQDAIFQELHQINNDCFIMGDLNAALQVMGSRKTNSRGRQLELVLNQGYLDCINERDTTYVRNEYEEKLDWVLGSQPLLTFVSNYETYSTLGTSNGHKPLVFNVSLEAENKPDSPRISYNFRTANWKLFRERLNEYLQTWDISIIPEWVNVDEYAAFITESLNKAAKDALQVSRAINENYTISEATRNLIAYKHKWYRRWKRTKNNSDKQTYYNYRILLENSLRNDKKVHYKNLMSALCHKKMYSDSVWRTVRKFHNKRVKPMYGGSVEYRNRKAKTSMDKGEIFAEYFEKEVYYHEEDHQPFHEFLTRQTIDIKRNIRRKLVIMGKEEITSKEVKSHIQLLRNSSPGADNVHNRWIKNYTELLVKHVTKLFNTILAQGHIPKAWKQANIILLLKPNKEKSDPSSYRPISLLSCFGKLLEKIVKTRLTKEVESRQLLPIHQSGFRAGKSTNYNLVRLERYAREQLLQSRHSGVIFFDIKAAFDSVWHDGLIYKINELRIPLYLQKYLLAFLEDRTASIEFENTLSRVFKLRRGTPQGSPLSPLLYIIYTADSMNDIPQYTEHGLFADDTALWTSSNKTSSLSSRLQIASDKFQSWCKNWKLKLQPSKTELLHFNVHPRRKYKNEVLVTIEGVAIKPKASTRYLGLHFDPELKWTHHLKQIESKVTPRISLLRYLSRSSGEPNEMTMMNLYHSIVRTVMVYGFPLLLTAGDRVWKRMQILQNMAIRAALNLPKYTSTRYLHMITREPKLKDFAKKQMEKALNKAINDNDNTLRIAYEEILGRLC